MVITATEFKMNLGKYLNLLQQDDIFVTKNGKMIAKVSNPQVSAVDALSGLLAGMVPTNYDKDSLREEHLAKYELND